jgi:hypothetical protein
MKIEAEYGELRTGEIVAYLSLVKDYLMYLQDTQMNQLLDDDLDGVLADFFSAFDSLIYTVNNVKSMARHSTSL